MMGDRKPIDWDALGMGEILVFISQGWYGPLDTGGQSMPTDVAPSFDLFSELD